MAVNAPFNKRQLGEPGGHCSHQQMPRDPERPGITQDPWDRGKDRAADHNHFRAAQMADSIIKKRVGRSEKGALDSKMDDQKRPTRFIRIAAQICRDKPLAKSGHLLLQRQQQKADVLDRKRSRGGLQDEGKLRRSG